MHYARVQQSLEKKAYNAATQVVGLVALHQSKPYKLSRLWIEVEQNIQEGKAVKPGDEQPRQSPGAK